MNTANGIEIILKNPKLKEHWVRRGIAFIFDIIVILGIFFLCVMLLILIIIFVDWQPMESFNANGIIIAGASPWLLVVFCLITILISMLFLVGTEVKFGATLGKKIMSLRVVPTEGKMIFSKGILRNLSKLGGILIGCMLGNFIFVFGGIIGFLVLDIVFGVDNTVDPRQKYTDKMASTTVLRTDIDENLEDLKNIPPAPASETKAKVTQTTTEAYSINTVKATQKNDLSPNTKNEMVKKYSNFFGISEARALDLYNAGYKEFKDFKDAIVEDLILVNQINPTIAREIINKISKGPVPED